MVSNEEIASFDLEVLWGEKPGQWLILRYEKAMCFYHFLPIQKHFQQLAAFVQAMKRKGCQIFSHLAAPCTGGSNLLNLSENRDELKRRHRAIFFEILDASYPALKQVDAFSLELPMRCNYWKETALHDYLKRLSHHLKLPIFGKWHWISLLLTSDDCLLLTCDIRTRWISF